MLRDAAWGVCLLPHGPLCWCGAGIVYRWETELLRCLLHL